MRRYNFKIFFIILLVSWMALIFYMSSRDANASTAMSNAVGMKAGQLFVPHFKDWSPAAQEAFAEKVDHPIRKCAHAAEYAMADYIPYINSNLDLPDTGRCLFSIDQKRTLSEIIRHSHILLYFDKNTVQLGE